MDRIRVESTSQHTAVCSDIAIREGDTIRLVFRATIVNNPSDPAASIHGTFVYQRKGKKEDWEDYPIKSLSSLKKGEGYQLDLHAGELLPLFRQIAGLYRLHRRQGVPRGKLEYVRLEENLAQFLQLSEADLREFLDAHSKDAVLTIHKVLRWLSSSTALASFISTDAVQVDLLNAVLGVASLRAVLALWDSNRDNDDEAFWQETIQRHAFVFSQLFAYPVLLVRGKAYVGGKRLNNLHGNVADFLARAETSSNALVIEIKTPATRLLGKEYRDGAYPPSRDLGGAIAQVLQYRDSLLQEINSVDPPPSASLLRSEPRCLVLIGDTSQLESLEEQASFERLRDRIQGVTVVTFDELFRRVTQLERLLSAPEPSSAA